MQPRFAWTFNAETDILICLAPIPVGLLASLALNSTWSNSLLILTALLFDKGHLATTLYPFQQTENRTLKVSFLISVILFLVLVIGAVLYGGTLLFAMTTGLAYLTIFHHARQYYGLIKRSQWKASRKFGSPLAVFDCVTFLAITIVPYLYWFAHTDRFGTEYVFPKVLIPITLNPVLLNSSLGIMAGLAVTWLLLFVWNLKSRTIPIGLFCVLASAFLVFPLSIIILKDKVFFAAALATTHGLQYHAYVPKNVPVRNSAWAAMSSYILIVLLLGGLLVIVDRTALVSEAVKTAALAFILSIHYLWDAFLWRKNGKILRSQGAGVAMRSF